MTINIISETHTTDAAYIVVEILDLGDNQYLKYGVCYNLTNDSPTISDCVISNIITTTGTYTIEVSNLSPAVTYYFKAFLESNNEVVYSDVKKISLNKSIPIISTDEVHDISATKAIGGGKIISNGGSPIIAKGVCWNTNINPTISDFHTSDGNLPGEFSSYLTGLSQNTTYYVRAYATNDVGISYGSQVSFTTLSTGITF